MLDNSLVAHDKDIYRIMSVLKVETDIVTSIATSLIARPVILAIL